MAAWTQEDLDELEKAIAMGALRVRYQDNDVTYRSLAEMERIRGRMRESLGLDAVSSDDYKITTRPTKGL